MKLVAERIPRHVFRSVYGLPALDATDAGFIPPSTLLDVYCHARGYMASTHSGPDHSRAARSLLKDYLSGKLLYCTPPPSAPDLRVHPLPATSATGAGAGAGAGAGGSDPGLDKVLATAVRLGVDTPADVMAAPGTAPARVLEAVVASTRSGVGVGAPAGDGARGGRARQRKLVYSNVLAGADSTDGMLGPAIPLPVAKHRSEKASVRNSRRRRRKGERDPDPYGCHNVTALESVVSAELSAKTKTAKSKATGSKGIVHGGRHDEDFTRVQRPYSVL